MNELRVQSLADKTVRPLCSDHHPRANVTPFGNVVIWCNACGFHCVMTIESYLALERGDEGQDVLK